MLRNAIILFDYKKMTTNYQELLDKAYQNANSFSLVWRAEFKFNDKAKDIEERLRPFLLEEKLVSQWPGSSVSKGLCKNKLDIL